MENFCKGLVLGITAGMIIGAVAVAKNKSLSSMVKQKADMVEKKVSEVSDVIKDKIEESGKQADCSQSSDSSCGQSGDNSQNKPCECK